MKIITLQKESAGRRQSQLLPLGEIKKIRAALCFNE